MLHPHYGPFSFHTRHCTAVRLFDRDVLLGKARGPGVLQEGPRSSPGQLEYLHGVGEGLGQVLKEAKDAGSRPSLVKARAHGGGWCHECSLDRSSSEWGLSPGSSRHVAHVLSLPSWTNGEHRGD